MIPTPSPIEPTPDQADTLVQLLAYAAMHGIDLDAGPLDEYARERCSNDWDHGPGVVCLPNRPDRLCVPCAMGWLGWYRHEHVAVDVLRLITAVAA